MEDTATSSEHHFLIPELSDVIDVTPGLIFKTVLLCQVLVQHQYSSIILAAPQLAVDETHSVTLVDQR